MYSETDRLVACNFFFLVCTFSLHPFNKLCQVLEKIEPMYKEIYCTKLAHMVMGIQNPEIQSQPAGDTGEPWCSSSPSLKAEDQENQRYKFQSEADRLRTQKEPMFQFKLKGRKHKQTKQCPPQGSRQSDFPLNSAFFF